MLSLLGVIYIHFVVVLITIALYNVNAIMLLVLPALPC